MSSTDENSTNLAINQSGRFWNANVEYVKENTELEPGIKLISTRSPYLGYASKYPSVDEMNAIGNGDNQGDTNDVKFSGLPELSLSLSTGEGEVLIVGCSHSSVQKIIQETKEYTDRPIRMSTVRRLPRFMGAETTRTGRSSHIELSEHALPK